MNCQGLAVLHRLWLKSKPIYVCQRNLKFSEKVFFCLSPFSQVTTSLCRQQQASPKTSMTAKPASAATYSTLESSWDSKTCQKGSQMLYFDCNLLLKSSCLPLLYFSAFFVLAVVNISANIPHCEIFVTVLPIFLQKLQMNATKISLDQLIFPLLHKMPILFTP